MLNVSLSFPQWKKHFCSLQIAASPEYSDPFSFSLWEQHLPIHWIISLRSTSALVSFYSYYLAFHLLCTLFHFLSPHLFLKLLSLDSISIKCTDNAFWNSRTIFKVIKCSGLYISSQLCWTSPTTCILIYPLVLGHNYSLFIFLLFYLGILCRFLLLWFLIL